MKTVIGLIPCAGTSSRLFNLPKFMLPMKDKNISLLSNWINILEKLECNKIIIGVSPNTEIFVSHLIKTQFSESKTNIIIKLVGNTETMNETIIKCIEGEEYNLTLMCMPDTIVDNLSPILIEDLLLNTDINAGVYIWNIRNTQLGKIGQCNINNNIVTDIIDKDITCDYNYGWGSVIFKPEFEKYIIKEDLHIGYSMKRYINDGNNKLLCKIMSRMFFDCGTVQGYSEYINYGLQYKPLHIKGTIIIVAVYINNDQTNYNHLINCLTQLRNVYKYDTIITVDNNSLNNNWHKTASELDFIILENNCPIHRYEMGAYKLALQYYRADKYIFIQGTIHINYKLDLTRLDCNTPKAIAFKSLAGGLHWPGGFGLKLINKLLVSINMNQWNNEPIVLWNCFCSNNLFVENMFNNGIYDLHSNTKNHSCAFERILGCYFVKELNNVDILPNDAYNKIFLCQSVTSY